MASWTSPSSMSGDSSASAGDNQKATHLLPIEKVFSIQLGNEVFRLSGASICSDAPSFFSSFFADQLRRGETGDVKTLYIDRDPVTFRDICLHLQGYDIQPKDPTHFVRLFADAQFYSLPRLIKLLYNAPIYVNIGDTPVCIPRSILDSPGNSPNYFSLAFSMFFSAPSELFPQTSQSSELLRPPPMAPPSVIKRDPDILKELLLGLRGYQMDLTGVKRMNLLRDARYYHLRGLEQHLIRHKIAFNPFSQHEEITLFLEDVKSARLSMSLSPTKQESVATFSKLPVININYSRPFVDDTPRDLFLEFPENSLHLHVRVIKTQSHSDIVLGLRGDITLKYTVRPLPACLKKFNDIVSALGKKLKSDVSLQPPNHQPGEGPTGTDVNMHDDSEAESDTVSTLFYEDVHDEVSVDLRNASLKMDGQAFRCMTDFDKMQLPEIENPKSYSLPSSIFPPSTRNGYYTDHKKSLTTSLENMCILPISRAQFRIELRPSEYAKPRGAYEVVLVAVRLQAWRTEKSWREGQSKSKEASGYL